MFVRMFVGFRSSPYSFVRINWDWSTCWFITLYFRLGWNNFVCIYRIRTSNVPSGFV